MTDAWSADIILGDGYALAARAADDTGDTPTADELRDKADRCYVRAMAVYDYQKEHADD